MLGAPIIRVRGTVAIAAAAAAAIFSFGKEDENKRTPRCFPSEEDGGERPVGNFGFKCPFDFLSDKEEVGGGRRESSEEKVFSSSSESIVAEKRPVTIIGTWQKDSTRSESMTPFLYALGVPSIFAWFLDSMNVTLDIDRRGTTLVVKDSTLFGENTTRVVVGAEEIETPTRTGRKTYMLSASENVDNDSVTIQCRLTSRGDKWFTRQSFDLVDDDTLREVYDLECPTHDEDVRVTRIFRRIGETGHHIVEGADCGKVDNNEYVSTFSGLTAVACAVAVVSVAAVGFLKSRDPPPSSGAGD